MVRKSDFEQRRQHLKKLTESELKDRFWKLAKEIINPMFQLAKTHTTPAIERSVLLRMGFSSLDAKAIVDQTITYQLMGKGCGHIVLKVAEKLNQEYITAGRELATGQHWTLAREIFGGNK
jgi:D-ornithine 4,5-aminomutase subunit alpha